jgi:hypothetical protein
VHTELFSSKIYVLHALQTNVAVELMAVLLTALWIVLAVVDSSKQHAIRRRQWFALLLAPFGAYLRWKLARLNGAAEWCAWFPFGTLAANLLACCIDFLLQVDSISLVVLSDEV